MPSLMLKPTAQFLLLKSASYRPALNGICFFLQPMAAVTGAKVAGAVGLGRQITAIPETYRRPWPVGQHHKVTMEVTVKGARALIKVYTDLRVTADLVEATYGPGLEPILMQASYPLMPHASASGLEKASGVRR